MYNNLQLRGFAYYNNPEMFKYAEKYFKYKLGKKYFLRKTQNLLAERYLKDFVYTKGKVNAWNGIDDGTNKWHNDLVEGCNTAFLLYLSDLPEEVGGGLSLKNINDKEHITIWPKKYDIVIMNQAHQFIHRVEPLKQKSNRYVCHIEFDIKGFK